MADGDIHHTPEMDRDLVSNYLDFIERKQSKAEGISSHGRLYDKIHHGKLDTYWGAASQAHSAIKNGAKDWDPARFIKWRPSKQLFRLMKDEMARRKMDPFKPQPPTIRKKT